MQTGKTAITQNALHERAKHDSFACNGNFALNISILSDGADMKKQASDKTHKQATAPEKLTIYYDGACPKCLRDRRNYEILAGDYGKRVIWFDITGKEAQLRQLGIDYRKALSELHIQDADGQIFSELDAYILLMEKAPLLKPLAWLISLPLIRPLLAKIYHYQVNRRLKSRGLP